MNQLKTQKTECAEAEGCPEYIAKIIVFDSTASQISNENEMHFCTGTLVSKNLILTSASCLTKTMRTQFGNNCSSLYVQFAEVGKNPAWLGRCSQILSHTSEEQWLEDKQELWRNDYAFIRLESNVDRKFAFADFSGINQEHYDVWSVDQVSRSRGVIRKKNCLALYNSYANPFAQEKHSPFIPLSDCEFNVKNSSGNTGSAVVKSDHLVGIVSKNISPKVIEAFKTNNRFLTELNPIVYASNLSCLTLLGNSLPLPAACSVEIDRISLAKLQNKLVKDPEVYRENIEAVTNNVLEQNSYFKYDVDFLFNNDDQNVLDRWFEPKLKIKCFNDYKSWLSQSKFRHPLFRYYKKKFTYYASHSNWKIVLKFDEYFYPLSQRSLEPGTKDYYIQFSPRSLKKNGYSDVSIEHPSLSDEAEADEDFELIKELKDCQS